MICIPVLGIFCLNLRPVRLEACIPCLALRTLGAGSDVPADEAQRLAAEEAQAEHLAADEAEAEA